MIFDKNQQTIFDRVVFGLNRSIFENEAIFIFQIFF